MDSVEASAPETTVVVYSHRQTFIDRVEIALGVHPAPGVTLRFEEYATHAELQRRLDLTSQYGEAAVCILDGEAQPTGGLGISRQFKNEREDAPAMLVVVARKDDTFLAGWSQADAVLHQPIDPALLASTLVHLVNHRVAFPPPPRTRTLLMKLGLSR